MSALATSGLRCKGSGRKTDTPPPGQARGHAFSGSSLIRQHFDEKGCFLFIEKFLQRLHPLFQLARGGDGFF